MTDESIIAEVEPARWRPLELFRTVYPDDPDIDKLDALYPGRAGDIYKDANGKIIKIIIKRVWPHEVGDEDETGLYSSDE